MSAFAFLRPASSRQRRSDSGRVTARGPSVWIEESGEPLVDLSRYGFVCRAPRVDGSAPPAPMVARRQLAERLAVLQERELAPRGYRWLVLGAWRSREALAEHYLDRWTELRERHRHWSPDTIRRRVEAVIDAPDRTDKEPGPCTGGAIDLGLWDTRADRAVDLGADFEEPTQRAALRWFESSERDPAIRGHRRLMADSLARAGFVGAPNRYWRWELGTQRWAAATGALHAPYGEVVALLESPSGDPLPAGAALAGDEPAELRERRLAGIRYRLGGLRPNPSSTPALPRPAPAAAPPRRLLAPLRLRLAI